MANKRIDELSAASSIAPTDLIFVGNPGTGELSKATANLIKYTIPIQVGYPGGDLNFTDAATAFVGLRAIATSIDVLGNNENNFYVHKSCVIKAARIMLHASITAGSNENWSMYIRVNDTTDTLIETTAASTNMRTWTNTGLSISLSAGDWFVIKIVNPTWATNPSGSSGGLHAHIELECSAQV